MLTAINFAQRSVDINSNSDKSGGFLNSCKDKSLESLEISLSNSTIKYSSSLNKGIHDRELAQSFMSCIIMSYIISIEFYDFISLFSP